MNRTEKVSQVLNEAGVPGAAHLADLVVAALQEADGDDICGLCGGPGADKYAHTCYWPGETHPDGPLVHADCEAEECRRAHSALTTKQRESFLRTL